MKLPFFFIVVCGLLPLWVSAQTNQLRNYTLEDGLPQSQVFDIAQDEVGYLWLGTQGGGVSRFDGTVFTTFTEREGLPSNYIFQVYPVQDRVWVGTKQGLGLITQEGITSYQGPQVNAFFEDDETLWMGTASGMYTISKEQKFQKATIAPLLDSAFVYEILSTSKGIWIATNKGLFLVDSLANPTNVTIKNTLHVTSLAQRDTTVFAATFTQGILAISLHETVEETTIEEPQRINDIQIINNQLWVATDASGIFIMDPTNYQIHNTITKQTGISVQHIREILQDKQGVIWIATSGGGFYRYSPNNFNHYNTSNGLLGNRIYALATQAQSLYLSHSESGVSKIDSLGIQQVSLVDSIANVKIKALHIDAQNNRWIGTDGKGLLLQQNILKDSLIITGTNVLNIKLDTVQVPGLRNQLFTEAKGFASNWIRRVVSHQNTVWIATYSSGIVKMQYNDIKNEYIFNKTFGVLQGIEDVLIKTIEVDASGTLWYGTQKGHLGYIENDTVVHLGDVLQQATAINSIALHKETLFLGTAGKGVWVSPLGSSYSFKKLTGAKKLTSDNCYLLLFDDEEHLWIGSEKGVDKVLVTAETTIASLEHFGRNEGFLGIETCLNAAVKDAQGNLWFGALYGLTTYKKGTTHTQQEVVPTLKITQVIVNYDTPILALLSTQKKTLLPDQNTLSFYYKTVDLSHPGGVTYRYRLDDSPWSPWAKSESQNLVKLAAGEHTFTVQSRDFSWNESFPVSYTFSIDTPVYKKPWFIVVAVFMVLFMLGLIAYGYIRKLKKRNEKSQAQLALKNHLLSLEQKALRLQMNPHFIFNVLNGIKSLRTSDPEKMNTTINSFALLLRGVLNNSRKDTISLKEEMETLQHYFEVEQLMATTPFEYAVTLDSDMDAEEILIPPMLIQPFVENAIKHGLAHLDKKGLVTVHFKTTENNLHGTITDNGKGIFQSQKNKKTSHQSVALAVTKERLESLGGEGALQLKEIKENDVVLGTEISFIIPLETEF